MATTILLQLRHRTALHCTALHCTAPHRTAPHRTEDTIFDGMSSWPMNACWVGNGLMPQRKALYATRQYFDKLRIKDPDLETVNERRLRLEREAQAGDNKDLKAADLLKFYLRNKEVR